MIKKKVVKIWKLKKLVITLQYQNIKTIKTMTMEYIINYLKNEIERCNAEISSVNELTNSECMNFETFLTHKAVGVFKAEKTKIFLVNLLLDTEDCIEREVYANDDEFKKHLETVLDVYTKYRVEGRPIHYNTNQMVNLCSLWEFENLTTIIKHIKNLLRN